MPRGFADAAVKAAESTGYGNYSAKVRCMVTLYGKDSRTLTFEYGS